MTENNKIIEAKETKAPESIYERLSKVDVTPFIEKKNGLNYLSWAKAWGLVKSIYPDANYKFREYPYFEQTADGNYQPCGTRDYLRTEYGVEVEAVVTIQEQTYSSKLYVMDFKNRALDPKKVTLFEINKTQMRALTKALAFAGLGLNVYAGEDLPSGADKTPQRKERPSKSELRPSPNELISIAKKRKVQYGGGTELVTDIVGLDMDGDIQANKFLNQWCEKDKRNQNLYEFIRKNGLATHGMKVGA
ncbi:hypothetical protein IMAU10033_00451 [Lactobacillus helveticus]|nr:DUF1071 domain-containing protein [Lactobacillus helveticus]NRO92542.1 hypothetical protein [Lactobacillus helveticus]